jgi:hypothetical protein
MEDDLRKKKRKKRRPQKKGKKTTSKKNGRQPPKNNGKQPKKNKTKKLKKFSQFLLNLGANLSWGWLSFIKKILYYITYIRIGKYMMLKYCYKDFV